MKKKILDILSSVRFYQLVIAFVVQVLATYSIIPQEIANAISGLLGASVVISTVDKSAKSIGK